MKTFLLGLACLVFLGVILLAVPLMMFYVAVSEARGMIASWRDETHIGDEDSEDNGMVSGICCSYSIPFAAIVPAVDEAGEASLGDLGLIHTEGRA